MNEQSEEKLSLSILEWEQQILDSNLKSPMQETIDKIVKYAQESFN